MKIGKFKKMFKPSKITKKLFFITSGIFIFFIIGTLVIQSLFFEKFYIGKKKNEISSSTRKFKNVYDKTDKDQRAALIREFQEDNEIMIAMVDGQGKINFTVKGNNDKAEGMKIKTYNALIHEWLTSPGFEVFNRSSQEQVTFVMGKVDKQFRSVVSVVKDSNTEEIIFTIASLQPVSEAVATIKEFYIYFTLVALILILVLSLFYSNVLAKPLVEINNTAKKMSELDFSESCSVNRNDELGSLASYLNSLSLNLKQALSSLKEANVSLEKDIEKERQLEKMRKEFISAVSHELKTPISLIDGYAVGLKDDIFGVDQKEYYLDIIIDEAAKMNSLVSDMMDLSQLESGCFKLVIEEFYIEDLLKSTLKKYAPISSEKNILITLKEIDLKGRTSIINFENLEDNSINAQEKIKVKADWIRLEQVITNFLTNALRNTEDHGSIEIRLLDKEENVVIEIENTGCNIPEEELGRLWDRFYKIDKSRSRSAGGTGIGLAIVKNILTLHHADFGVENTEIGVKFYFILRKA